MSLLTRHKKPGGFEKLVQFLETTPQEKRDKLVSVMTAEDPGFMSRVTRSIITMSDLKELKVEVLMEITHGFKHIKTLALAIYKLEDTELIEKFKKCLTPVQMVEFREATAELGKVSKSQREGAQLKLIEHTRLLQETTNFRIKPYCTG